MRRYSLLDQVIMSLHQVDKTPDTRLSPGAGVASVSLNEAERAHVAGLMRVNHAGEVCAQALYRGHAFTATQPEVKSKMEMAAQEERDHLAWCEDRLQELESHTSYLNPLWYSGAFAMGALAGMVGDRFSLGFVQETEQQVVVHLESHLAALPIEDEKSRKIIEQMRVDEGSHAAMAKAAGAQTFPWALKFAMKCCARVMTTITYWI